MKNALSKRGVAAIICLAVILLSTFLGARRSLTEKRETVEDIFINGEDGNGRGIQYDLSRRIKAANELLTVAGRYLNKDCDEIVSVENAIDNLQDASSPSAKCAANSELDYAVMTLYGALGSYDLTKTDSEYRENSYTDFNSADEVIGHSTYNVAVDEFNKLISDAPASFFAKICGIKKLEKYEE